MNVPYLIEKTPKNFKAILRSGGRKRTKYLRFGFFDGETNLRAHAWENCFTGIEVVRRGDVVYAEGKITKYLDRPIAVISRLEKIPEDWADLLCGVDADPTLLYRLGIVVSSIRHKDLKKFCRSVFSDREIFQRYVTFPGSLDDHHAYESGLLKHSVECAEDLMSRPRFSTQEREIGIIATLFHDVGKIWTQDDCWRREHLGEPWNHDIYTTDVIAEPLTCLENSYKDAAHALKETFRWIGLGSRRSPIPMYRISHAVLSADHVSAQDDAEKTAFRDHPHWHQHATFKKRIYFRCRPQNGAHKRSRNQNNDNDDKEV